MNVHAIADIECANGKANTALGAAETFLFYSNDPKDQRIIRRPSSDIYVDSLRASADRRRNVQDVAATDDLRFRPVEGTQR